MDERLSALEAWLRRQPGLPLFSLVPASGDASFRRYFRLIDRSEGALELYSEDFRAAFDRDAVFARVRYHAMRGLSTRVLRHLHNLSLRYHLERQSGAISRDLERGTRSVSTIPGRIAPTRTGVPFVSSIRASVR